MISDKVPPSVRRAYKVAGMVCVRLASGEQSAGPAFACKSTDKTPREVITKGTTLDGAPYPFACSRNRIGQGEWPVSCAYFERGGVRLFFYTEGGALPDGAAVTFDPHR
ncbi:MAG: hypothetical protein LBV73_26865 [Paraburkholderia sp.]|jgi:hypothetical protein|nr:hypothetical protein [Paraburkholderia sp.]